MSSQKQKEHPGRTRPVNLIREQHDQIRRQAAASEIPQRVALKEFTAPKKKRVA